MSQRFGYFIRQYGRNPVTTLAELPASTLFRNSSFTISDIRSARRMKQLRDADMGTGWADEGEGLAKNVQSIQCLSKIFFVTIW